MKTKKEALNVINNEMKECKEILLSIIDGMATWKGNPTSEQWKKIGYVSALSWAFGIKKVGLKHGQ